MEIAIGYLIVGVKSLDKAVALYRDTMGFKLLFAEPAFHFASIWGGDVKFNLAEGSEDVHGSGDRNTGIGFHVTDVDAAHAELAGKGDHFTMPPERCRGADTWRCSLTRTATSSISTKRARTDCRLPRGSEPLVSALEFGRG